MTPDLFQALMEAEGFPTRCEADMEVYGATVKALAAAQAEVERFRYTSDKQALAWKERAEKAERALEADKYGTGPLRKQVHALLKDQEELIKVREVLGQGVAGIEEGHAPALVEHLIHNRFSEDEVRTAIALAWDDEGDMTTDNIIDELRKVRHE